MLNRDFIRFGGGGETFITPFTLACLITVCVLALLVPRKYITLLLLGGLLIPITQVFVVDGIHLFTYRILMTVVWIRVLIRGPRAPRLAFISIDKAVILWGISAAVTFSALWATTEAFVNRIGLLYDAFGIYFLMRLLIRDEEDVHRMIKAFALIWVVIAGAMVWEQSSGASSLSALGAFALETRNERIRSMGPFAHAIIAGTCGAVLFPLFVGLWWQGKAKAVAAAGMVAATAMTVTSASSTAIVAYLAGLGALALWPVRQHMKLIRWGVLAMLIALHLVMKAPVWALIARIDVVGGNSGYHRYELINQSILHFSDWWFLGQKTTYQWGYNLWDTADTYVETAVTGGLLTLLLLIATIAYCFRHLGNACRDCKDYRSQRLLWALGAALFANVVGFGGISYFDQSFIVWYGLLVLVCSATIILRAPAMTKSEDSVYITDLDGSRSSAREIHSTV